jgi:uncharacterized membrane protein
MSEPTNSQPGIAFWIIGVVALFWNLIGLFLYYTGVSTSPEELAAVYTEEQVALIASTPAWATSANALAVTFGVIGALLLLLRKSFAVTAFVISLAAIVVWDIYMFAMTNSLEVFGTQVAIIQGMVLVIAVFLLWYASQQKARGVLG